MYKSNRNLIFIKDNKKSYVYIKDGNEDVGILMWDYTKKKWIFFKVID